MTASEVNIDVMILTYNGDQFLEQQLLSISKQMLAGDRIFISDDGSTDRTLSIIKRFQTETEIIVTLLNGPGKGVILNFFSAIKHTTAPYVLIADQDDIWLDNKRSLFAEKMQSWKTPHLIFSDALIWWPETNIKTSFWTQQNIHPEDAKRLEVQLFRNSVQGASMAINRSLINQLVYCDSIVMHDWWCALTACVHGKISIIEEPTLLYRQHGKNQIGAINNRSFQEKRKASRAIFKQALAFAEIVPAGHKKKTMLNNYKKSIESNLISKLIFLIKYRPKRSNFLRSVTLWASILTYSSRIK